MRAESNACIACARSKRKCGRQIPSCARCAAISRPCVYPSSRTRVPVASRRLLSSASRSPVSNGENVMLVQAPSNIPFQAEDLDLGDDLMLDLTFLPTDVDFAAPPPLGERLNALATKADWFLAPATWRIHHRADTPVTGEYGDAMLRKYVGVLQSWFKRWVTHGSNPFIHAHLYRTNFPACVQVAYTTMTSYVHRTPATTGTVLRIVEDQSKNLLQENGAVLDRIGADDWVDDEKEHAGLFAQLARLHALAVYQIIGLLDGDIRARHVAEGRIAVMRSWAGKLLKSAAEPMAINNAVTSNVLGALPKLNISSQQQWRLWILSETIRRTWLVTASLPSVYLAMQQRWAVCPGGIMYSNRNGLWDASSSSEWEKLCLDKGMAFLQRFEGSRLFKEAEPADIDDFAMAMLDMTFDKESLEMWRGTGTLPLSAYTL